MELFFEDGLDHYQVVTMDFSFLGKRYLLVCRHTAKEGQHLYLARNDQVPDNFDAHEAVHPRHAIIAEDKLVHGSTFDIVKPIADLLDRGGTTRSITCSQTKLQ